MGVAEGEAVSGCGFGELVDEVAEVGVVEVHVFVDVGEVGGGGGGGGGGGRGGGAAEDVGEGLVEVGEEAELVCGVCQLNSF